MPRQAIKRLSTWTAAVLAIAVVALLAFHWVRSARNSLVAITREPAMVMGTYAKLVAVVPARDARVAEKALDDALAEIRAIESRMSVHLERSEISLLNAAPAYQPVALSGQTMQVLRQAQLFSGQTQGAFDVTCRPILELWKRAGKERRLPTDQEIAADRNLTGWRLISLGDGIATKSADGAGVDLGGIAKKYAIDRSIQIIAASNPAGAMVNIGGDVRCLGITPQAGQWDILVQDPFVPDRGRRIGQLRLSGGAVCTSGNYERFVEIQGRRFSHIVDPRTGWPADAVPSVTVVGPDAMTAGIWATALSVLGADGIKLIPPDAHLEVMMVIGGQNDYHVVSTPGMKEYLSEVADGWKAGIPATQTAPAARE